MNIEKNIKKSNETDNTWHVIGLIICYIGFYGAFLELKYNIAIFWVLLAIIIIANLVKKNRANRCNSKTLSRNRKRSSGIAIAIIGLIISILGFGGLLGFLGVALFIIGLIYWNQKIKKGNEKEGNQDDNKKVGKIENH